MAFGQGVASRDETDRSSALTADLLQHCEIVASADSQIAGNGLALALFRQNTSKETPAFLARKAFLSQRQGLGQRHSTGGTQPALRIAKGHLAAVVLDEIAGEVIVQIDIEGSRHALLFFLSRRRRWRKSQLDSQSVQDRQRFS